MKELAMKFDGGGFPRFICLFFGVKDSEVNALIVKRNSRNPFPGCMLIHAAQSARIITLLFVAIPVIARLIGVAQVAASIIKGIAVNMVNDAFRVCRNARDYSMHRNTGIALSAEPLGINMRRTLVALIQAPIVLYNEARMTLTDFRSAAFRERNQDTFVGNYRLSFWHSDITSSGNTLVYKIYNNLIHKEIRLCL